jgi:hypothetical protein
MFRFYFFFLLSLVCSQVGYGGDGDREELEKQEVVPLMGAPKEGTEPLHTEECEECRRQHEVPQLSDRELHDIVVREESKWPVTIRRLLGDDGTIIIQRVLTGESKGQLRVMLTPFDTAKLSVHSIWGRRGINGTVSNLEMRLQRVSTDRLNELLSWEEREMVRVLGGETTTISPIGIIFAHLISDGNGKDWVQVMLTPMDITIFKQLLDHGAQEAVRRNLRALEEEFEGMGKIWLKSLGDRLSWKPHTQRREALTSSGGAAAAASAEGAAAVTPLSGLHNDSRFYYTKDERDWQFH